MSSVDGVTTLVRERNRLLGLLRLVPRPAATLVLVNAVAVLIPTGLALTVGWLVARIGDVANGSAAMTSLVAPLALMALLLIADELSLIVMESVQSYAAGLIDGAVRAEVRALCFSSVDVAVFEDPEFVEDASRASDIGEERTRSPGTAAVGQLRLLARIASALLAAAVLATFSLPLAVGLFAAAMTMRAILRRQWIHLADVRDSRQFARRRVDYWTELATGREGAKEIRLFDLGRWVVGRRSDAFMDFVGPVVSTRQKILARQGWTTALALASGAAVLLVPGLAAERGDISTATLVTMFGSGWAVCRMSSMGHEAFDIEYGLGALRALDRLRVSYRAVGSPSFAEPGSIAGTGAHWSGDILVEDVHFSYPTSPAQVLAGIDLRIGTGETLAVVGHNGVGKSTLIKLLSGLLQPTGGHIEVGAHRLGPDNLASWRSQVAVLFQDFNRYPLTVAQNISMLAPEHADDTAGMRRAAETADAADFIAGLGQGLDTLLGGQRTGSVDVSGGQWQRLAIARVLFAVAHGRRLVVLDEPTSHLDIQAEANFYDNVVRAIAGTASVVLISHRLSTTRNADRIALIDAGRVAESGTHDELMRLGGQYADIYSLQAARFREDAKGDVA